MQFLAMSKRLVDKFPPDKWTPELLEAEAQQVRTLYAAGTLRSIWRRQDMPGAVLLLEAASEADARAALASLPLAKLGMTELVECTGLDPYPGLGPRS